MSQLALLDACVLVPQRLSSLLLTLAEADLFEPRWSEQILSETERALVRKLRVPADLARRRVSLMRSAFPEASVVGFKGHEAGLTCHRKDRHVLAAAIAAGAGTLVTANLKDFPDEACTRTVSTSPTRTLSFSTCWSPTRSLAVELSVTKLIAWGVPP